MLKTLLSKFSEQLAREVVRVGNLLGIQVIGNEEEAVNSIRKSLKKKHP